MTQPARSGAPPAALGQDAAAATGAERGLPEEREIPPREDLRDALAWMAFGVAVLVGSLTMDRLERQNINPYTVPGLLPGLLGIGLILLGGVLAWRSLRRGARKAAPALPEADAQDRREEGRRIWIVAALCTGYGVLLIGHGLPFWAASTIYISGSILILQRISREASQRRIGVRALGQALLIGLIASVVTHLVFQELFLVRMP